MSRSGQLYTNPMQREQNVTASFQLACCDVPDACCDFVQPRGMSIKLFKLKFQLFSSVKTALIASSEYDSYLYLCSSMYSP